MALRLWRSSSLGDLSAGRDGMTLGAEAEGQDRMYHGNGPVPRFSLPDNAAAWIDTTCMLSPRSCDIFRRKAERERGCIFVVVRRSSEHLLTDFGVIIGLTKTEMSPARIMSPDPMISMQMRYPPSLLPFSIQYTCIHVCFPTERRIDRASRVRV